MPMILAQHAAKQRSLLRDVRPVSARMAEQLEQPKNVALTAIFCCVLFFQNIPLFTPNADLMMIVAFLYFRWILKRPFLLPFKIPADAGIPDPHNPAPGKSGSGKSEGILYLGNVIDKDAIDFGRELWLTNTDARTHILYLGTTGSGKTEGLKGLVANGLSWGSGFVYIDGKADTDLWAAMYSMARRFGRDDDLLVLNYMTGNTDNSSVSNSMNPFSNGSASYLANMITNFMPDAGGDNAMWKERAVALMFALMPALTYRRDHQNVLLDIGVVRDHIELQPIIRLSRDTALPERVTHALNGYLHTLPGFVDAAFDDEGNERPPSPDQPMYDLQVARQQHGYLSMQFTRSLQMMADEYSYIFKSQLADVEVLDVVLNRRILVVLIPALEKSGDEAANLGKIVAASLKGMMGATLGNTVEGSWETAIGSKQARAPSPFVTVFDEVGYYTAKGMAVMAAQARSLGFALVFASQDLPSMESRVKQEAKSITANCNLKIFGRIEDPTDTKDFIVKHAGTSWVMETKGMTAPTNTISSMFMSMPMYDDRAVASTQARTRVDYDHLKNQREGEAHLLFAEWAVAGRMFYVATEKVKALRVHRFLPVAGTTTSTEARERNMHDMATKLKDPEWAAKTALADAATPAEIGALATGLQTALDHHRDPMEGGIMALASVSNLPPKTKAEVMAEKSAPGAKAPAAAAHGGKGVSAKSASQASAEARMAEAERRAGLPPLQEGDQYAIDELHQSPAGSPAAAGGTPAAPIVVGGGGFAGTDADLAVITQTPVEEEPSVMDFQLSPEIASILEQSAKKLSRGLSGKTTS